MQFQQLEMFTALVEEGNLNRAADRVYRTAPAVSISLRKLEEEMGVPLFDRSNRNSHELTAAGRLLYSYATRILEMRTAATRSVHDLALNQGTLRLGTHETVSLHILPSLLHQFHEVYASMNTEIVCGPAEQILNALQGGTIDLALIADVPDDPSIKRELVMRDELVLIVDPGHRLATAKSVGIRDLVNEFLLVQGTKSKIRARIVRALRQSETPFRLGAENIAIEAIKRMVADGLGIGFVPLMCVGEEKARGELLTLKIDDLHSEWDLWLVQLKDHKLSPAARAFMEMSLKGAQSLELVEEDRAGKRTRHRSHVNKRKAFRFEPKKAIHC